jgi:hypothetical protein
MTINSYFKFLTQQIKHITPLPTWVAFFLLISKVSLPNLKSIRPQKADKKHFDAKLGPTNQHMENKILEFEKYF